MMRLTVSKVAVLLMVFLLLAFSVPAPIQAGERSSSVSSGAVGSWQIVPVGAMSMYALDLSSATEGWMGGGAGFMHHYLNGNWFGFPTNFQSVINAIDMVSPTSGWAVTWQGEFLRYNGSTWAVYSEQGEILDDISMISETSGFAVGGGGTILRYNGSSWSAVGNPATRQLKGVDMLDASYGWAVGLGGFAVQWNGSGWVGGSVDPNAHFTDVDVVSATDTWAVGLQGVIYHHNGAAWSPVLSPTTSGLNAVSMISANNGWAVGDGGVMIHYDGSSWQRVAGPTTEDLNEVHFADALNGWAVGKSGITLHYVPAPANLTSSSKTVNKAHAAPGEELEYTIHVINSGELASGAVTVTDVTPAEANYVATSATTTRGTIQTQDPLLVNLGSLEPGGEATITFRVTAKDLAQSCWMIINEAVVSGAGTPVTRRAGTVLGDCPRVYLPSIFRTY